MARTMADVLIEQGEQQGELRARRQTLLLQLRRRFGELPQHAVDVIEATQDIEQLDLWLERFATAQTLEDVAISPGA